MKKLLFILVIAVLTLSGCSANTTGKVDSQPSEDTSTNAANIKYFGVGQSVNIEKSKSKTTDNEATGAVSADVVAVGFDSDYKIVSISYDAVSANLAFDSEMKLPTDYKTVLYPSKKELANDYGMKVASAIKKEWFEQANALEEFSVGKTVEEVIKAIEGKDADLLSGATVDFSGFVKALESAKSYSSEVEGATKIGLGLQTNAKRSKEHEEKPSILFEVTIVGVALDDKDAVVSNVIDMAMAQTNFDPTGQITSDTTEIKTKLEIKDAYGMKAASPIGKEWNEQAIALSEFINGKTIKEIFEIKTFDKDAGHPAALQEEDLATSATITVETILPSFETAIKNAK